MKYYLVLLITFFLSSCDPDKNTFGAYYTSLRGNFNNTTESVALGDTLKLEFKWPDTIFSKNLSGENRTDIVNSLQYASFGLRIFRVDTINRKTHLARDSTKLTFILKEGIDHTPCPQPCNVVSPYFQNNNKPYRCILYLVPLAKGIFFIEIVPQAGAFKVNKKLEGLFTVNFNVTDKHHQLVSDWLGNEWLIAILDRDQRGFGTYCFRVK